MTVSKEMIIELADNMARGAANMNGQGYDTLISSREQLEVVVTEILRAANQQQE